MQKKEKNADEYCCNEFKHKLDDGFITETEYFHIGVYAFKHCNSCEKEHRVYSAWILEHCPFCGTKLIADKAVEEILNG